MKLPALITSDLHLVASASTEYRWGLFPWLAEQCKLEKVKTLLILGDLTDAKDNHSAELVNRTVQAIKSLPVERIIILAGNHDWLKAGQEFFRFLNVLPNVEFITKPTEDTEFSGPLCYFLPYSKAPAKDWGGQDFSHYDYLFMHQTVSGAVSSNGQKMDGEVLPALNAGKVYSGDIHVPQVIGPVEYVGSPYHVHMGDAFKPRCVLIEKDRNTVDLHFDTISRVTVAVGSLKELYKKDFVSGDQVKLRIELDEADKHQWQRLKREALEELKSRGVDVQGVELVVKKAGRVKLDTSADYSPGDAVMRFVQAEELGPTALEVALEIIES